MRKGLIFGFRLLAAAALPAAFAVPALNACTSVVVGRNASATGAVLFGHNEDDYGDRVVNAWKVPRIRHRPGETVRFRSGAEIPQIAETWAMLWFQVDGLEYSDFYCNEWGVTVASDACPSREDSPDLADGGAGFPLRRVVAERARTAAEGVRIAGEILDRFGYPSSGRTLVICDQKEGWLLSMAAGRHWAAERVPDDGVTVLPNTYVIRRVRSDDRKNFILSADDPAGYARARGWWSPESDGPFDFARSYRTRDTDSEALARRSYDLRQWRGLSLLTGRPIPEEEAERDGLPFSMKPRSPVGIRDVMAVLRDHFEGTRYAVPEGPENTPHAGGERPICHAMTLLSIVAELRGSVPPPMTARLWTAFGRPDVTPYTPWYEGIAVAPDGFHVRSGSASPDEAFSRHFDSLPGTFAPDDSSAFWILKNRADRIDRDYFRLIAGAVEWRRAVEEEAFAAADRIEKEAGFLYEKDPEAAGRFLAGKVDSLAMEPLRRLKRTPAP
jgi:dipeptidase